MLRMKRLLLVVLLRLATCLPRYDALAEEYQQDVIIAPAEGEVEDDRTLLDTFGDVAKEYLTQKVVRFVGLARVSFFTW